MSMRFPNHRNYLGLVLSCCLLLSLWCPKLFAAPLDSTQNISLITQRNVLAGYRTAIERLLPMKPPPFNISTVYSISVFEQVRDRIFTANLPEVQAYITMALANPSIRADATLWVAAKSVWVDYLVATDEFNVANKEAVALVAFADSMHTINKEQAYLVLAKSAFYMDDYLNANSSINKVMEFLKTNTNKRLEARVQLFAGAMARRYFWGATGRALPYFDKSISAAEQCGDTITIIRALILKHSDIAQPGNVNDGYPLLARALNLTIQSSYIKYAPVLCENLFFDLEKMKQYGEAAAMILQALHYTQLYGMPLTETHMYNQLAAFYKDRRMFDSSIFYLDQCKNDGLLAPGIKTPLLEKADVYRQMGNYKEASMLYDSGMTGYLNTFILQGQNSISRWETNMRMRDKETVIQQNENNRKMFGWVMVAICTALFITMWAFIRQRSLRQRLISQNKTILQQSDKLKASLSEKEILLKEIHHRVKNNLQVIESLLDMHQDNSASMEQQQGFSKARTHIRTISIIHQNLYQQDHLSTVSMQYFANNLFVQTESLFNKERKNIVFVNDIKDVQLDIDTAVPLGLILNELFTNIFKYVLPITDAMRLSVDIIQHPNSHRYTMVCSDNGPGLPEGFIFKKSGSLGMELIQQLSRQIGGAFSYNFQEGSCFTVDFLSLKGRKESD